MVAEQKLYIMGQNNPPLGWHIFDDPQTMTAICGQEFSISGRTYPGSHMRDRLERVCADCVAIANPPYPAPADGEDA